MDDIDDDRDREAARRAHDRLMADVDAEIREDRDPAVIEERRLEAERRRRWMALPPVRLRPGVAADRLTDAESAWMDRCGY